jgi:hypothetical protein
LGLEIAKLDRIEAGLGAAEVASSLERSDIVPKANLARRGPGANEDVPRLRSGFRQQAQTPAKRLKFGAQRLMVWRLRGEAQGTPSRAYQAQKAGCQSKTLWRFGAKRHEIMIGSSGTFTRDSRLNPGRRCPRSWFVSGARPVGPGFHRQKSAWSAKNGGTK